MCAYATTSSSMPPLINVEIVSLNLSLDHMDHNVTMILNITLHAHPPQLLAYTSPSPKKILINYNPLPTAPPKQKSHAHPSLPPKTTHHHPPRTHLPFHNNPPHPSKMPHLVRRKLLHDLCFQPFLPHLLCRRQTRLLVAETSSTRLLRPPALRHSSRQYGLDLVCGASRWSLQF